MSRAALFYRPDIDGLRAIAVAAVLLFHAFPAKLPGGFVGVDIFLVISGYLITGIIFKELESGRFTFSGFYARRIRRIFPALALVLTTTLLLGWATLLPNEFRQLSKHTVGGAGFVSNLVLWKEASYFDPEGQTKPLLHLWSLGIEEQFYIGWPLLLAALFRYTRRLLPAIGAVALASFCFNVVTISHNPTADYYNPATRVWELLIGAGLALYLRSGERKIGGATRDAAAILGSVLIAVSLILTNNRTPFPGWWALLPTSGAAFLILAGGTAWVNRHVLATRGFVFVGLISYPLYLWHWPLLTYFRLLDASDLNLPYSKVKLIRIAILGLSCLLSWATWRFWETPLRSAKTPGRLPAVPLLVAAMASVCAVGLLGSSDRVPVRLDSPEARRVVDAMANWPDSIRDNHRSSVFKTNEFRSGNPEVTLFVGDSHAFQYIPRVKIALAHNPALASAEFATYGNCPPLPGLNQGEPGFDCPKFYRFWTAEAERAKTVVISAYWENYFTGMQATWGRGLVNASRVPAQEADIERAIEELGSTIRRWTGNAKRVVLVFSNPASSALDPILAVRRLGKVNLALLEPLRQDELNRSQRPIEERLAVLAASTGARFIRPADYFCRDGACPAVDVEGNPLYIDSNHLRARTVEQSATFIDELLRP
jgi:peptidoglycan/LPS O-acetylase OafA/YrhL